MEFSDICRELSKRAKRIDAEAVPGQPVSFELTITGTGGGILSAVIDGGETYVIAGGSSDAVCRAETGAIELEELLSGRTSALKMLASGRIRLTGETSVLFRTAARLKIRR